jgi:hypothetical protein
MGDVSVHVRSNTGSFFDFELIRYTFIMPMGGASYLVATQTGQGVNGQKPFLLSAIQPQEMCELFNVGESCT